MASVELSRLLERRRATLKGWLEERNITSEDQFLAACVNEDVYASTQTLELAAAIYGQHPEQKDVLPEVHAPEPVTPVVDAVPEAAEEVPTEEDPGSSRNSSRRKHTPD